MREGTVCTVWCWALPANALRLSVILTFVFVCFESNHTIVLSVKAGVILNQASLSVCMKMELEISIMHAIPSQRHQS